MARQTVKQAIDEGRIRDSVIVKKRGKSSVYSIDPDHADREWIANTNSIRGGKREPKKSKAKPKSAPEPSVDPEDLPAPSAGESAGEDEESESGDIVFAAERARKERALADQNELRVEEACRRLADVGDMRVIVERYFREWRDRLLNIPSQHAPSLYGLPSAKELAIAMEACITEALEDLIVVELELEIPAKEIG